MRCQCLTYFFNPIAQDTKPRMKRADFIELKAARNSTFLRQISPVPTYDEAEEEESTSGSEGRHDASAGLHRTYSASPARLACTNSPPANSICKVCSRPPITHRVQECYIYDQTMCYRCVTFANESMRSTELAHTKGRLFQSVRSGGQ